MIISPMPSTTNVGQEGPAPSQSLSKIRMRTQASPTEAPLAQNEAVDDNKDQADADVENTQPISPQFARLAKERRALQIKQRELESREKALESKSPEAGIPLARLKQEPLKVLLEDAGLTWDDLAAAVENHNGNSEVATLKAELAALKAGVDNKFESQAAQQEQQVLAEIGKEAKNLAATGEDYALIRETNSVSKVVDLIHRTYKETGEIMDTTEAMALIESGLEKRAEKIAAVAKVRDKFLPQAAPQTPPRQQGMRTLTNRDTAAPPMTPKQRAMAAFYGQLQR